MLIGSLSLSLVPSALRQQAVQQLLERVKCAVVRQFPHSSGQIYGKCGKAIGCVWTLDLMCGSRYRRCVAQLVSEDAELQSWRIETLFMGPFSGPFYTWPGGIGFSMGYFLGNALLWMFRAIAGKPQVSEWEAMQSALVDAIAHAQTAQSSLA